MSALSKYDAACAALAEAVTVDEVKELRDQSEAMRAYARQAKNKDLEVQAAEIRIRAERRIGELMAAQRDAGAMAGAGRPSEKIGSRTNPISKPPTLDEVGIDKKTADRARKYAAIPDDQFQEIVSDWRDRVSAENERVGVNLLAAGERAQRTKKPAQEPADVVESSAGVESEEDVLRQENAALRAEIERLNGKIAELSAINQGAVISKLQKQKEAADLKRRDALDAAKRMEYRLKQETKLREAAEKRVRELEGEGIRL